MYHRILKNAKWARVYGDSSEDVAHEAWILALQRGYFTGKMLRESARNLRLWRITREVEISEDIPMQGEDPEDIALQQERDEAVRVAMRKLSRRHTAIVYLRYWERYRLEEIASAIGESISEVYTSLTEAEDVLRRLLVDFKPKNGLQPKEDMRLPLFSVFSGGSMNQGKEKPTVAMTVAPKRRNLL